MSDLTPSSGPAQPMTNYLVPSSGGTHAIPFLGCVLSASPATIDWNQFANDQFPFQPQGVFIDNTAGTATATITINPLGWNVNCPAGAQVQAQFPAPIGQTMSIVGQGTCSFIFVDFPVLPSAGVVQVSNLVNVNVVSPNPLPVIATINVSGTPYQVNLEPLSAVQVQASYTTGAKTATVAAPANTFLRKLILTASPDIAEAAAADDLITVTLNAITIGQYYVSFPAAAIAGSGFGSVITLDFEGAAIPAGAAGNLVISQANNLTAGRITANAYFA